MSEVNNRGDKTSRGGEAEKERTCSTFEEVGECRGTTGGTHIVVILSCSQVTLVDHLYSFLSFLRANHL